MKPPPRRAIIDIGSNSIRLVVFGGAERAPVPVFNEKLMAGLGRGVVATGALAADGTAAALKSLSRMAALVRLMQPLDLRVVATAAVREASNGPAFLDAVRALGLPAEVLSGEEEALAAAQGVISTHPFARGLVADLGGGSLELARVADGEVHERISLPLGVMRVAAIRAEGTGRLRKKLRALVSAERWLDAGRGETLYLVGGAWRALARVHMHQNGWPLPVLDNYTFPASDARAVKADVRRLGVPQLLAIPGVKQVRAPQLDDAAALLASLCAVLQPRDVAVSASGLREGLLFQRLSPALRRRDPLIEGLRHTIGPQLQSTGQDLALLAWTDGAFPGESDFDRRLRHATCLIAGTGWTSNPEFRALAGEDMALHGAWSGVDHADRAVMAMALHIAMGGDPALPPPILARLAPPERLERARGWGEAIRLAQRLSGGEAKALAGLPLRLEGAGELILSVSAGSIALVDASVERRLARLGLALGRTALIEG